MPRWTVHLEPGGKVKSVPMPVAVGLEVYSFGSDSDSYHQTAQVIVHIFNTVSLHWRTLPPETPGRGECPLKVPYRNEHTAVLIEDSIYMWGGNNHHSDCLYKELYTFNVDIHKWFKPDVSGTVPEARRLPSVYVLGKVMYLYGGIDEENNNTNGDIYKLDTRTMVWSVIYPNGTPPRKYYHKRPKYCSATILGKKMFEYGAMDSIEAFFQKAWYKLRVFDIETNSWLNTSSHIPGKLWCHRAFTYNGELYIYYESKQTINDLWKLNPETLSWRKINLRGEAPYIELDTSCCCIGDRLFFFGHFQAKLHILDFSPSLKTLCKLAVIQYGLCVSELTHSIRWELATMTNPSRPLTSLFTSPTTVITPQTPSM